MIAALPPPPVSPRDRTFAWPPDIAQRINNDIARVAAEGPPAYLKPYAQIVSDAHGLAQRHPGLVQVDTIGKSRPDAAGKSHDIIALRLGAGGSDARRAGSLVVAAQHAREVATPAVALQWASDLVERSSNDPQSRMLLDTRAITVVPVANPVGYDVVVDGAQRGDGEAIMHRTNGPRPHTGVDLNRNYRPSWGKGESSAVPGKVTYRGPKPLSEPETRALKRVIERERPGSVLDLHSFSDLVLNTPAEGPLTDRGDRHARLAERLAHENEYVPMNVNRELYPAGGSLGEWAAYSSPAKAALTLELGRSFMPDDTAYRKIYGDVAPMLDYATLVADAPLTRSQGPEFERGSTYSLRDGGMSLALSDARTGANPVTAGEYVTDPLTRPGRGTPLAAMDGELNAPRERVRIPGEALNQAARGAVYVRGRDSRGHWGPLQAVAQRRKP